MHPCQVVPTSLHYPRFQSAEQWGAARFARPVDQVLSNLAQTWVRIQHQPLHQLGHLPLLGKLCKAQIGIISIPARWPRQGYQTVISRPRNCCTGNLARSDAKRVFLRLHLRQLPLCTVALDVPPSAGHRYREWAASHHETSSQMHPFPLQILLCSKIASTDFWLKRLQIESVRAADAGGHALEARIVMAPVAQFLLAQMAHLVCSRPRNCFSVSAAPRFGSRARTASDSLPAISPPSAPHPPP